jgi:single-strand DNA-binding protein
VVKNRLHCPGHYTFALPVRIIRSGISIHHLNIIKMNSVKLIGNVGREINVKDFEGGKMLSFSLATDEGYVSKEKGEVKNTVWHTVVVWRELAQRCETFLTTGKMVSIEGRLTYRQYVDKDNRTVRRTEVTAHKVEEVQKKQEAAV